MKSWLRTHRTEILLYVAYVLFCGFLVMKCGKAPSVFPEEAGYIGWGRRMLGQNGNGLYFLPGYSLLLVPVLAFSQNFTAVYPWLLAINVLMNGTLIVGLYHLTKCSERRGDVLSAVAVALYVPFVLYTQKVICETLLIVCGVWIAVFLKGVFEGKRKNWIGVALLGCFSLCVHSRAFVLLPVFLVFLLICFFYRKEVKIGVGIVLFFCVLCLAFLFFDSGVTSVHLKEQITGLFSPDGLQNFITTLLTQSAYWILSTFGLASAGIWYGCKIVRKRKTGWQTALFLLLYFGATALLSALYMSHRSQEIHIIYGRYNDGAIAGILLLGMMAYRKERLPKRVWILSLIPLVVTALFYRNELLKLPQMMINICGLYFSKLFVYRWDIWAMIPICMVITALFWSVFRKNKTLGILLFGIWFLVQIAIAEDDFSVSGSVPGALETIDCLEEEDQTLYTTDSYIRSFFQYACYRPELRLSEEKNSGTEEGNVEISAEWKQNRFLLWAEDGTFLWAKDQKTAEKYSHLLLPTDGEVTEAKSRIEVLEWKDGLTVRVTNLGSPWLCMKGIYDVRKAVRLGVRFFDRNGELLSESRFDFEKNMRSGDSQEFSISWSEDSETVLLEPVQEYRNWFSELGDDGRIAVNRRGQQVACPETDQGFHILYPQFLISRNEKETLPDKTNVKGFFGGDTGEKSSYCNLKIDCRGKKELVVTAKNRDKFNPTLTVTLNNSVRLSQPNESNGCYVYSLDGFEGNVETITLECETYNPFDKSGLPSWLSFLSLDSNYKFVQFAVHRMEDIMGKSVNHHDYGIAVEQIEFR